jgi:5-methylthioadenosine/S-adenosylhomocysteine deaminase
MKIDILVRNCTLLTHPGEDLLISPAFIAIADERIAALGHMDSCPICEVAADVDGQGQLAMPGLVNGHAHSPMTLFRGMADDLELMTWLTEHIFPAEARMVEPEMVYWCSKLAVAEMLLSGTTTVADGYFLEDEVARACSEAGMRCVAAQAVIDFPAPGVADPSQNIAVAEMFLERWQNQDPLISPALFGHSPYTCSNVTLQRAKALARQFGVPFFVHLGETAQEQGQIVDPQGKTPLLHLDALGLLDADTVCVHCVWLSEEDQLVLKKRGAAVVSCPQSNAKLASGRAPLKRMREMGIRVGLGTDGAASNNSLDLFREMEYAALLHKVNPAQPTAMAARDVLRMATQGGADVLGLGDSLGGLAPGALADIILIDLNRPHLQPFHSPNLLVYSRCGADVRNVIVNGKMVVQEGRLLTLDLEEVLARVRGLAAQVGTIS